MTTQLASAAAGAAPGDFPAVTIPANTPAWVVASIALLMFLWPAWRLLIDWLRAMYQHAQESAAEQALKKKESEQSAALRVLGPPRDTCDPSGVRDVVRATVREEMAAVCAAVEKVKPGTADAVQSAARHSSEIKEAMLEGQDSVVSTLWKHSRDLADLTAIVKLTNGDVVQLKDALSKYIEFQRGLSANAGRKE